MKIHIYLMFLLCIVLPACVGAKEIKYEKAIEIHLGCNDSEAEADIIHSVRKITEDAELTGVHIIYKEKTDYCGYKLMQIERKPRLLYGANTGYALWLELEKYFLIERPKEKRKIDDLGYPIE